MQIKSKENTVAGLIFMFLGVVIYVTIPGQIKEANFTELGARFFPQFLSILLIIMSFLLVISGFVQPSGKAPERPFVRSSLRDELKAIGTIAFIILNIFLMPITGFAVASILSLSGVMLMLKVKTWWYFTILIVFVLVVQFFFVNVMYVQLP